MTCSTGKISHKTKSHAFAALRAIKNKGLNVYLCNECNQWHLGKQEIN